MRLPGGKLGAVLVALLVLVACSSTRVDSAMVRAKALSEARRSDTVAAWTGFLQHWGQSEDAPEARARLRDLLLSTASTRAERVEVVGEYADAPGGGSARAALVEELLTHTEFRLLQRLATAIPALQQDPRVHEALAPSWVDAEHIEFARLLVRGGGALQVVGAAQRMAELHDPRTVPYLIDTLRHATTQEDLEVVEYTSNQYSRWETGRQATSVASRVESSIRELLGYFPPRRECEQALLVFRDDRSEAVRDFVEGHFSAEAARALRLLGCDDATKVRSSFRADDYRLSPWLVEGFIELATNAPQPAAREYVALTLGVHRVEAARAALVSALDDASPPVRRAAVAALACLGDCSSELQAALDDPDTGVARMAAQALGALGLAVAPPSEAVVSPQPSPDGRTPEEVRAHIQSFFGRRFSEFAVARSWQSQARPAGLEDFSWGQLLGSHLKAHLADRWPLTNLALFVKATAESSPDFVYLPILGLHVADRPLELRQTAEGLQLDPGPDCFAVLFESDSMSTFATAPDEEPFTLDPALERQLRAEARAARERESGLDPSGFVVLTRSLRLGPASNIGFSFDAVVKRIYARWDEEFHQDQVLMRWRQPAYLFDSDFGGDRSTRYGERFWAEADRDWHSTHLAGHEVLAACDGVVESIGDEAEVTLRTAADSTVVVEGLIVTHLRVGDVVRVGDLLGIGPLE